MRFTFNFQVFSSGVGCLQGEGASVAGATASPLGPPRAAPRPTPPGPLSQGREHMIVMAHMNYITYGTDYFNSYVNKSRYSFCVLCT